MKPSSPLRWKYGASTALIMAFGMVANIIVARFTRLKYIFLTGHHTFYMACMIGVTHRGRL